MRCKDCKTQITLVDISNQSSEKAWFVLMCECGTWSGPLFKVPATKLEDRLSNWTRIRKVSK